MIPAHCLWSKKLQYTNIGIDILGGFVHMLNMTYAFSVLYKLWAWQHSISYEWTSRFLKNSPCAESDFWKQRHSLWTESFGGEPGLHLSRWWVVVQGSSSVRRALNHQWAHRASFPSQPLNKLVVHYQDCTNTKLHWHTHTHTVIYGLLHNVLSQSRLDDFDMAVLSCTESRAPCRDNMALSSFLFNTDAKISFLK